MGVPGLWDILRPAGEQRALTHLAVVDGFERNSAGRRGLRIGIDASIWFYHATYGREGENPELRTLFFRCARLMRTPFLPLFVFDGPARPALKRKKKVSGKDHWMVSGMCEIIEAFGFEWRMAPGEAEAELAYLNRVGVIDAIVTDDVDTFVFGAMTVIRNPGKMLTGNAAHPVRNAAGRDDGEHAYVYRAADLASNPTIGLTHGGLVLVALLRGGDYSPEGLPGCGPGTAHALARAGFGDTLLNAARTLPRARLDVFLDAWRDEVRAELKSNSRGLLGAKKAALARTLPDTFPDLEVLALYAQPITSELDRGVRLTEYRWEKEPDLGKLAALCERKFEWGVRPLIVKRFRTVIWEPAVLRILRRAVMNMDTKEQAGASGPVTPSKRGRRRPGEGGSDDENERMPPPGTPSKMIARHFSSLHFDDKGYDEDDEDGERLIVKIHGKRAHASTDGVPEYRLEIAPAQLVRLTVAGIQGTRPMPSSSLSLSGEFDEDDNEDDDEDDEEEGGRQKRGARKAKAKATPDPQSHMRIWMPACMVARVEPALVEAFEAKEQGKMQKKAAKGAKGAKAKAGASKEAVSDAVHVEKTRTKAGPKARRPAVGSEEEEEVLSAPEDFSDVFGLVDRPKAKAKEAKARPVIIDEEEEEGEEAAAKPALDQRRDKPKPKPKPPTRPSPSRVKGSSAPIQRNTGKTDSDAQPTLSRTPIAILEALDTSKKKPRTRAKAPARTASSSLSTHTNASASSSSTQISEVRPFPIFFDDDGATMLLPLSPPRPEKRAARTRTPSATSSTSSSLECTRSGPRNWERNLHKSPRKSREHVSPTNKDKDYGARAERLAKAKARAGLAGSVKPLLAAQARVGAKSRRVPQEEEEEEEEMNGDNGRPGSPTPRRPQPTTMPSGPSRIGSGIREHSPTIAQARAKKEPELIVISSSSESDSYSESEELERRNAKAGAVRPNPPTKHQQSVPAQVRAPPARTERKPAQARIDTSFRSAKPSTTGVARGGVAKPAPMRARMPLASVNMAEVIDLD